MLGHDVDLKEVQSKLAGWLKQKMPRAENLSISDPERSGAGFANVSISFKLIWEEDEQQKNDSLLFRGAGKSDPVYPDFKLDRQFNVMRCLKDSDVPVPEVYWMESSDTLFGFPFYIMGKIDGDVPSEFPPYHSFGVCYDATPEKRARMWFNTIEAMAKVHKVEWKKAGLSFLGVPGPGTGPIDREMEYWDMFLNWAKEEEQPVIETAYDWLMENRYEPERVTLCWGDARLPNAMFNEKGDILAVLDWDMAILSDPESDLAFIMMLDFLLSEGTDVPRLEGFPEKEETVQYYEKLTGWKVKNLFYNEVFSAFRSSVVVLKVQKSLQKMGIELPGDDPILNNMCTRKLAELLGLPAPGVAKTDITNTQDLAGLVQFNITGPCGGNWYIKADKGEATRQKGTVENPDVTVTVSFQDWDAVIKGEMNRFNAWTSGKIKIKGDQALYQQLENMIDRAWKTEI
jgi:aminoglycoside phosphotransferase (APT) family kinase protein/putative sterol carrier protein